MGPPMTQPFTPTPEMLAILAEIEASPRSAFLKLPIRMGNPGTFAETLTGKESFLNSAEKKLVRSYRDELETWLYYRAMRLMAEEPGAETELVDADGMLQSASSILHTENAEEEAVLLEYWHRCNRPAPLNIGTARACLETGIRLVSHPSFRVLLGVEAERAERFGVAHGHFSAVFNSNAPKLVRAHAVNNLGWLYWQVGNYQLAMRAYHWAATLNPEWVAARVFSLVSSGIAGHRGFVRRNSKILEDMGVSAEMGEGKALIEFCALGARTSPVNQKMERVPDPSDLLSGYPDFAQAFLAPYTGGC